MLDGHGNGRTVISCHTDSDERIDLLRFSDGTLAVRRNDQTVGVWAPADIEAGLSAYCDLAGIAGHRRTHTDLIVVLHAHRFAPQSSN
jgi:hypothetical protein